MAKVQRETLLKSILSTELYQWKQGKVLRRSTAGTIVLACLLASQALYHSVLYDWGSTGAAMPSLPSFLRQIPLGYWLLGVMNVGDRVLAPGVIQDALRGRRLAGIHVGDDADVANIRKGRCARHSRFP